MKREFKLLVLCIILLIFVVLIPVVNICAGERKTSFQERNKPFKIRATCYTWTGNRCANGSYPKQGLSVAGKREWLGKAIVMYEVAEDGTRGDFIGYFDFTDTGYGIQKTDSYGRKYGTIQAGESIDVFRNTLDACYEWIGEYGDYIYIQFLPGAEG